MDTLTGNKITLIPMHRPLRDRLAKKKAHLTGNYYFVVPDPKEKRKTTGFYMSKGFEMDGEGSVLRLRVELANDHLQNTRISDTTGYYLDEHGGDTYQPIIARLTRGRGFLAGATMGEGMASFLDRTHVYDDVKDAARGAHDVASYAAEEEREYQHKEREREEAEEAVKSSPRKQEVFDAIYAMLEEKFPDTTIRVNDGEQMCVRFFEGIEPDVYVTIDFTSGLED